MGNKEPIQLQFENLFGIKVDYGFLNPETVIKIPQNEKDSLKVGGVLRIAKSGKRITLVEDISSGGQGTVYKTDLPGYAVKIYGEDDRTRFTQKKIEKILHFNNENPNICWPSDIVLTQSGVFVGFLMPLFNGRTLNYLLTGNPERIMKNHVGYSRLVQVEMILKMLNAFKYLHEHQILVADIKLENVLYSKDTMDICFVDMDSVQIGEFNCQYSTDGYDPPEVIQCLKNRRHDERDSDGKYCYKKYYASRYRTLEIESYAMSVLIYRFLMEQQCPYAYEDWLSEGVQEGEYNPNKLCIEQKFAYGVDTGGTKETAYKSAIWSHFPSFLKEAFVDIFKNQKRYSDDEWIKIFLRYKRLLENGELQKVDSDCMNPFPKYVADYNALQFTEVITVIEQRGFTLRQAVDAIIKAIGNQQLNKREIVKKLKQQPYYMVGDYSFQLGYNIGVLKKIKCEYVL